MQLLAVFEDWVYHLLHIGAILVPSFLALGMLWYLVKHIWPQGDGPALNKIVKAVICIVAFAIILILLDKKLFEEPLTTYGQLDEISEDIGIDGIQDYVLEYWDPWEIVEYVLPE